MKALVLAGGAGTRLRPLSHTMAKQLVPVANRPVLFYGLEAIRDAGITDVGIIVGDREAEIRRAVGDGGDFGLSVTYIRQESPLGLAHCVLIAREFLGDDDFLMYLGDNIIRGGVQELLDDFRARGGDASILLGKVTNPQDYGIADLDDQGNVLRLTEKPREPTSDLAIIGAYAFSPAIHQAVLCTKPSWRNEREITTAIQWLLDHGGVVRGRVFDGYWKDTGQVGDLLACNQAMLDVIEPDIKGDVDADSVITGPVVIGEGARIIRSRITGPVSVGWDTTIVDSVIGPHTSIGDNCHLEHAGIEYSIVLAGSSIQGVRGIRDSLIGREVRVGGQATAGPAPESSVAGTAHRLVLGDQSQVLIAS